MYENYKATKKDLELIEEGIKTVWRTVLNFIFSKKNFLKNIAIISYDSSYIYLWTMMYFPHLKRLHCGLSGYYAYKINHNTKLKDEWQLSWRAGSPDESLNKLLPEKLNDSSFKIPKISGGLLTPFIELQKKKNLEFNPYVTIQSYLATIVHEFGHIYWMRHKLWYYSNKKENVSFLKTAKQLYEGKKVKKNIYFPMDFGFGELYAFCAEYAASEILWKNHKRNLDVFIKKQLEKLIREEQLKNLDRDDSNLTPSRYPHNFAFVFGKIIVSNFPKTWPRIMIMR